jgi:hypothetical protein
MFASARWRTVAFIALMAVFSAAPASAQFGIKGGINLSSFVGGDAEDFESTPGLNLGASIPVLSLGRVQLLGEVYYRQKGAEFDPGDPGGVQDIITQGGTAEIGLDYVEIPVLARVNLGGQSSRIRPFLVAGPAFGWQLDCGVTVDAAAGGTEPDCDDLTENFGETFRDYEMGAVVGGGIDFSVGGIGSLSLDARYTRGLSDIGEGENALNIRNQAFTLMLGYSFGTGGGGMGGMGGIGAMGGPGDDSR